MKIALSVKFPLTSTIPLRGRSAVLKRMRSFGSLASTSRRDHGPSMVGASSSRPADIRCFTVESMPECAPACFSTARVKKLLSRRGLMSMRKGVASEIAAMSRGVTRTPT